LSKFRSTLAFRRDRSLLLEPDDDDTVNTGGRVVTDLNTLLVWCELDPADTWEMKRNDLAQQVQGNRNVFIDYPEFAWLLFDRPLRMAYPAGASPDRRDQGRGAPGSVPSRIRQDHHT
jgi:hypothetical protein